MERHPDFLFDSWRDRKARTHVRITHSPTGLQVHQDAWLGDHAHIDAWKAMSHALADRLRELNTPQPPPISYP